LLKYEIDEIKKKENMEKKSGCKKVITNEDVQEVKMIKK